MRSRRVCPALAIALATCGAACTSTQTSASVSAPSSTKCQFQISSAPSSFSETGGSGSLSIATNRECSWSAASSANWIALASTSGQGVASVSYSVAPNSVPQTRSAAIAVEGQTVQLSEAAAPCRYTLNRNSDAIGYQGGSLSVALTTLTGCGWSTSSDSGWLVVASGANGNASATIGFTVAANPGGQRVGHALVGGQPYVVTQQAAPAPPPAPAPAPTPTPAPSPSPSPSPAPSPLPVPIPTPQPPPQKPPHGRGH